MYMSVEEIVLFTKMVGGVHATSIDMYRSEIREELKQTIIRKGWPWTIQHVIDVMQSEFEIYPDRNHEFLSRMLRRIQNDETAKKILTNGGH